MVLRSLAGGDWPDWEPTVPNSSHRLIATALIKGGDVDWKVLRVEVKKPF